MATVETAEGKTLIVENNTGGERLWIIARMGPEDGITKEREMKMYDLFKLNALEPDARPRSRSDLTADAVGLLADLLVGYEVAEGRADRREEVSIERIHFEMREGAKTAHRPYVPDWEEDWPEDGSDSDKVRYILDNEPTFTGEEIAAGVGCSRSLVSDIKARRAEAGEDDE